MNMIEAYPLYWPEGRPRTERYRRERSRFETGFARARNDVSHEVQLMVGRYTKPELIISTNIQLRKDGLPLAGRRQPDDVGVAVYFTYRKKQVCFACDRWDKIEHNMQAIAKTIDALRGVNRWGTGDMVEAAFRGFEALPSPDSVNRGWRETLGILPGERALDVIRAAYLRLRSQHHPDKGGDATTFNAVQQAYDLAVREVAG